MRLNNYIDKCIHAYLRDTDRNCIENLKIELFFAVLFQNHIFFIVAPRSGLAHKHFIDIGGKYLKYEQYFQFVG